MRIRLAALWVALVVLAVGTGCSTLTQVEEQKYENLMAQGAPPNDKKSPVAAALLNILPGVGDIVNGEWGAFALDLLLWPVSILWAIPQGAITAQNLNKKATLAYYQFGPGKGKYDPDNPTAPLPASGSREPRP